MADIKNINKEKRAEYTALKEQYNELEKKMTEIKNEMNKIERASVEKYFEGLYISVTSSGKVDSEEILMRCDRCTLCRSGEYNLEGPTYSVYRNVKDNKVISAYFQEKDTISVFLDQKVEFIDLEKIKATVKAVNDEINGRIDEIWG